MSNTVSDIFDAATFDGVKNRIGQRDLIWPILPFLHENDDPFTQIRQGIWRVSDWTCSLRPPMVWETEDTKQRENYFSLNAFQPILHGLKNLSQGGVPQGTLSDDESLLLAIVLDWCGHGLFDPKTFQPSRMVFRWYDMAVGCRAAVFAYFLQRLAWQDASWMEAFIQIAEHVHSSYVYLMEEQYWAKHSNHGLYQAIGLFNLGYCLPELKHASEAKAVSMERMEYFFRQGYSQDGFWLEHSPGYQRHTHVLITETLGISQLPQKLRAYLGKLRLLSTHALSWFVTPDKTLALFGDTPVVCLGDDHPAMTVIQDGWYVSKAAGYAMYRNRMLPDQQCYFAVTAAFHKRMHKHLDGLSFIWWCRGQNLVIDSGRYDFGGKSPEKQLVEYGFFYDDPMRMYVESNRAHNTVEIDEQPDSRHNRNIYGSGIRDATLLPGDIFTVLGQVPRHSGFTHTRRIFVHAEGWLLIMDTLSQAHPEAKKHIFDQWITFAPALIPLPDASAPFLSLALRTAKGSLYVYSVTNADAASFLGQKTPFYAGWYSPSREICTPAPSLRLRQTGAASQFVTLLTLAPALDISLSRDTAGQVYSVSWRMNNQERTVMIPVQPPETK